MALKTEYTGKGGFFIVRVDEKKYYFGDGKEINAFGISPNQFLRFHPYMEYVGDKAVEPTDDIKKWIESNT